VDRRQPERPERVADNKAGREVIKKVRAIIAEVDRTITDPNESDYMALIAKRFQGQVYRN
jgi:hypothetical protein